MTSSARARGDAVGGPWAAALITVLCVGATGRLSAQPTLTVRAESRLELDVRRTEDGLAVTGALRDDLGAALSGQDVSLELSHAVASAHQRGGHVLTRVVTATGDGTFSTRFQVPAGDYAIDATYEGAPEHTGTRATRFFDLDRARLTLRLSLDAGSRIDLSEPDHVLTILATSEAGGGGLEMIVSDDASDGELARGTTDADGGLRVTLSSARLGPPAAGRIIVRTTGDASRAEAQSELPVVRLRPTATTLEISAATFRAGETLEARGLLTDGVAPLEREAITIVSGTHVLATVLTDESGHFRAALDDDALAGLDGTLSVIARFEGPSPWIPGSESEPRDIVIERPRALGWLWAIVSIALAAIAVRWSLRRERAALPAPRRADGAPGVALGARRSLVAQRHAVSGTVRDATSGEPVADAVVRAGTAEVRTDAQGRFELGPARDATSLEVEHPEYLGVATPLVLPHRGEHDAMQFRMASRRAVSFAALRQVAVGLAPDGEIALALTQREIFELLRARGASPPALPDLVARVELACYAPAPPEDAAILEIRRVAGAILARPAAPRPAQPAPNGRR